VDDAAGMFEDPQGGRPDEAFEARAALKLALRGYAAAAVAGALWFVPAGSGLLRFLAVTGMAAALYVAVLALAVAGQVTRNILGRMLGLEGARYPAVALGVLVLAVFLGLGAAVFALARHLYTGA
jgi:hypothetical protein